MCKTSEVTMGSRAGQERGRTSSATSPYKPAIAWCDYNDGGGLVFVTTALKNSAGALVWSWLSSSDRPCPAQS